MPVEPWVDTNKTIKLTLLVFCLGGLFLLYYLFNPSQSTFFLSCPIKMVTGYHCPGCGSQRAVYQLLHGHILAAFRLNPLMVLTLPLLVYGLGLTLYNYIFSTSHRISLFYNNAFIFGYFAIAILYWVLRNIPYAPFTFLAPTE